MKSAIRKIIQNSPLLSTVGRALRHHRALQEKPEKTKWGFLFKGHTGMISGTFEPKETAIVQSILNDTDVFINIGANLGIYCAHALNAGKTCIAFEPHPENVAILLQNLKANDWTAEVHAAACGAKPAILERLLIEFGGNSCGKCPGSARLSW